MSITLLNPKFRIPKINSVQKKIFYDGLQNSLGHASTFQFAISYNKNIELTLHAAIRGLLMKAALSHPCRRDDLACQLIGRGKGSIFLRSLRSYWFPFLLFWRCRGTNKISRKTACKTAKKKYSSII